MKRAMHLPAGDAACFPLPRQALNLGHKYFHCIFEAEPFLPGACRVGRVALAPPTISEFLNP
jgi:hypothetical protein